MRVRTAKIFNHIKNVMNVGANCVRPQIPHARKSTQTRNPHDRKPTQTCNPHAHKSHGNAASPPKHSAVLCRERFITVPFMGSLKLSERLRTVPYNKNFQPHKKRHERRGELRSPVNPTETPHPPKHSAVLCRERFLTVPPSFRKPVICVGLRGFIFCEILHGFIIGTVKNRSLQQKIFTTGKYTAHKTTDAQCAPLQTKQHQPQPPRSA